MRLLEQGEFRGESLTLGGRGQAGNRKSQYSDAGQGRGRSGGLAGEKVHSDPGFGQVSCGEIALSASLMPIPRKLVRAAYATLSDARLREAAECFGKRNAKTLPRDQLVERLAGNWRDLYIFVLRMRLSELQKLATLFGIGRRQSKAALENQVYDYVMDYDEIQARGQVKTIDDALKRGTDTERFHALLGLVEGKITKRNPYASLRPSEKVVYQVGVLLAEVNNGGLEQYLSNSSGNHAQETIGHLETIKADSTARLLKAAAGLFPQAEIPTDWASRRRTLASFAKKPNDEAKVFFKNLDDRFHDGGEQLSKLVLAYVRKHREEFD